MSVPNKEAQVILAIEAIRPSRKLSIRDAAKLYNVPFSTLRDRITGTTSIAEHPDPARRHLATVSTHADGYS
jgi:hypothetical protein